MGRLTKVWTVLFLAAAVALICAQVFALAVVFAILVHGGVKWP